MSPSRVARISTVMGIGIVCLLLGWILTTAQHTAPLLGTPSSQFDEAERASLSSDQVAIHEDLLSSFDSAQVRARVDAQKPLLAAELDDSAWQKLYPRTNFNLARFFMLTPGKVETKRLVRNEQLNSLDSSIPEADVDLLDMIVVPRSRMLGELMENYGQMRHNEMLQRIREGEVNPAEISPASDAKLLSLARLMHTSREQTGDQQGLSVQDDFEQLKEERPPLGVGEDFIYAGGKVYLQSKFKDLPQSDAVYGTISILATEFLGEVVNWFELRGLARPRDVDATLKAALQFTALEARSGKGLETKGEALE